MIEKYKLIVNHAKYKFTETNLEEETNLYFLLYSLLLSKLNLMQVTQI